MTTWAQPTIHINGTGKADLLNGYRQAMAAVRLAIDAVRSTAPHGRDYYVQRDNPIQMAMREHAERLVKLQSVFDELQALAIHVSNQGRDNG